MEEFQIIDKLNFIQNSLYPSIIKKDDILLWSGEAFKINYRSNRQNRDFLITKKQVYNIGKKGNFFIDMFTKTVKRSFSIESIKAITYSTISNNFIMHIPSEYDYYLCTTDKDDFIKCILYNLSEQTSNRLKFFMVDDIDLFKFTRYEGQRLQRLPQVTPNNFDYSSFMQFKKHKTQELIKSIETTEVILSRDGANINENSFEILKPIGKGYFGRVFLVEKKDNKQLYALKVISKMDIIKRNFFENLKNEKKIMETIDNPFVVKMEYCFSSPSFIFFAMKFKQGGEIYYQLRKMTRFPENIVKFYSAQILSGLAYLHSKNIMYRDLKPENVLLDECGNACLADFGISKILNEKESTKSFVGTPEYVAPEIILQKGYNKSIDIWCFGILLFEMTFGLPPFYNKNPNVMLNWITKVDPTFPALIPISIELQDLIFKVL